MCQESPVYTLYHEFVDSFLCGTLLWFGLSTNIYGNILLSPSDHSRIAFQLGRHHRPLINLCMWLDVPNAAQGKQLFPHNIKSLPILDSGHKWPSLDKKADLVISLTLPSSSKTILSDIKIISSRWAMMRTWKLKILCRQIMRTDMHRNLWRTTLHTPLTVWFVIKFISASFSSSWDLLSKADVASSNISMEEFW